MGGGTPYGYNGSTVLSGTALIDNSYNDVNAFVDFELTVGSRTFTEGELDELERGPAL